jgi:hypothetical protein
MKKYYVILAIAASLSILTPAVFLSVGPHIYHNGEQIPGTMFTFDGFTYQYPPVSHPMPGESPTPTSSPALELCAVFKLNVAGESANQAPGTHISYPTSDIVYLNPNGNTKTDLGDKVDNQFYTIVSYNLADQTISMVYG